MPEQRIREELASGAPKPVAAREVGDRFAELCLIYADREHAEPGHSGPFAASERPACVNLGLPGWEAGPEHIVLARDGRLCAAVVCGPAVATRRDSG